MKTLRDLVAAHLNVLGVPWTVDLDVDLAHETETDQAVVITHNGVKVELTLGGQMHPVFRHLTHKIPLCTVYYGVGSSCDERDFEHLDDAISFAIQNLSLTLVTLLQESPAYFQLCAETNLDEEGT